MSDWNTPLTFTAQVAATGTFYKPLALPEEYGVSRIPTGWDVINVDEIECSPGLPTTMDPLGVSIIPPYKQELEYLESTGTQWIDTGIIPDALTASHYVGQATTSPIAPQVSTGFGSLEGFNRYGFSYSATGCVLQFVHYLTVSTWQVADYQHFTVDLVPVSEGMRFDFTNIDTQSSESETRTGTIATTLTCTLFRLNGSSALGSTRVYTFSMTKNNVKLIDLIPVLDNNNVPCMYDKVSEQCLYNQGTGDFLYNTL